MSSAQVPPLPPRHVELIVAAVDVWSEHLRELEELLDGDEQDRARRFKVDAPRTRFVVGRGLLRRLVGQRVGTAPQRLKFGVAGMGKPFLAAPASDLQFNLSHSHNLLVLALARSRALGVDVEQLRSLPQATRLAERFFSPREHAALAALPEALRSEVFLRCWTLKEAYLKATGGSIATGLGEVETELDELGRPHLAGFGSGRGPREDWSVFRLEPAAGYVSAVVVTAPRMQLTCRSITPDGSAGWAAESPTGRSSRGAIEDSRRGTG